MVSQQAADTKQLADSHPSDVTMAVFIAMAISFRVELAPGSEALGTNTPMSVPHTYKGTGRS